MAGGPPRSADLDFADVFADVFGGPPRRSSGNEHSSRRSSLDTASFGSSAHRARSGETGTPVFGDRGSGDRRRHLGEEFYRDIFPVSEAALPRRAGAGDWGDVFGVPASPGSTTRPPSRFRSQSGDKKDSSNHISSMESEGEGTPASVETIMDTNKFHFSFYKWAGKGALLVLPGTMEEKDAAIIGLKSFPQVVVQGFDLIDEEDRMSTATGASKSQTDYEDSKSGNYSTNSATKEGPVPLFFDDDYIQGMKHYADYPKNDVSSDSLSAKSSQPPSGERSHSSRVKGKVTDFMKVFSPESSPKRKGAPEVQDQPPTAKNESKTELQDKFTISSSEANEDAETFQNNQNAFIDVPSPMSEAQERMEKPILTTNSRMEGKMETASERNEAAPDGMRQSTRYSKNDVSLDSLSTKTSRLPSREKSRSSRIKGKVKNFMKIFSPEASPKRKRAPEAQSETSSVKNESKIELQDNFTLSSSEACEDARTIQDNQNAFIDVPSTTSEVKERMEKPVLTTNSKMEGKMGTTSERNEAVPNESIGGGRKDNLDNTVHHEEIFVEDLDGFLVEHITEDPILHNDQEKEQMKIAESKIREWSRGKEGNIRSLLSTLQYVLWPESGWKPIPLVDVIEGAAVKKAYQKALLCLHPDKLQQRGATMHQKHVAEKVFDILQESWKEFNSVTFG
ncbi:hypothetical protein PR202_gb18905 [Eleusine coracana subsp. coracana]|uniref:J domain-containing protein required for chloroplast accumulation response 1 n=1 Tax=Eleusine coracana subsp. coracana TaxID=191504 RepID=A0AAV5F6N1_ELECO|nr:hypothetical protein PR202_gb18905 [Eleusine coracana subsp. coracana]